MKSITVGSQTFEVNVFTLADTARSQLDAKARGIYEMFAERELEFGFNPAVIVEYPSIADPATSDFLADPNTYISNRVNELEKSGPISRVVVLTTFGQRLLGSLAASGYAPVKIDMPAGPDNTYAFSLDRNVEGGHGRLLYLEAVNEADEKIRPTFVLQLMNNEGRLCGGACGAVHARDGKKFAYLATLTLAPGLPPTTGARLSQTMLDVLKAQGVTTVHLGTQTAGRFYEKLGFRVTHRLVQGLRTRVADDGRAVSDDLMMLAMDLGA